MSAATWSLRQCFERADALADQHAELRPLIQSLGPQALSALIDAQRELIVHLARNLKAGHATPPTPGATQRTPMRPVAYGQPTPQPPSRVAPAVVSTRADGLLSVTQAHALTGFSPAGFHLARQDGRVPAPRVVEGRSSYWHPDQLAGVRPCAPGGKRNARLSGAGTASA